MTRPVLDANPSTYMPELTPDHGKPSRSMKISGSAVVVAFVMTLGVGFQAVKRLGVLDNVTADDIKLMGGILALVVLAAMMAVWMKSNEARGGKRPSGPFVSFDDPTMRKFDTREWKFVHPAQAADGDFHWDHQGLASSSLTTTKFDREQNVNANDLVYRMGLDEYSVQSDEKSANLTEAARNAATKGALFYAHLSRNRGCVPNDYGGPMFLLPGLIIACYVAGRKHRERSLPAHVRTAMTAYILNHQQQDGGWGTHIAGVSTNFGSVLNYVAARLLGVPGTHAQMAKARTFMATREGALGAPLWAKLWLAVLGCYDWQGVSPVPPEMWILPEWFPFHPKNTWCHARMVALPMSFLYGSRFVYLESEIDPVIAQLRVELYPVRGPYHRVDWMNEQGTLSSGELYGAEPTRLLRLGNFCLNWLMESTFLGNPNFWLRAKSLNQVYDLIKEEDETNAYICIGPVNKALNIVCAMAKQDEVGLRKHVDAVYRYLWVAEDGMKMQGYVNSMVWDSSFALLSVCSLMDVREKSLNKTAADFKLATFAKELHDFLVRNQVDCDPRQTQQYRDPSKGGWGFSTKDNTYIVSDCTAEALRAAMRFAHRGNLQIVGTTSNEIEAVDLMLWSQNPDDDAWASYEKRRGYAWYEWLNPAAVFGDIMIDYSYVECTSSCVQALVKYYQVHGKTDPVRAGKCLASVKRALLYLFKKQFEDGSWFGQWGVCFTYATLFAVEALASALQICDDDVVMKRNIRNALRKAVDFLLVVRNQDGGWGESVEACALKMWTSDPSGSNVVNTAWALMTLVSVLKTKSYKDQPRVERAAREAAEFLIKHQDRSGDWAQQRSISGVFNKTCGITYTSYRNCFPVWALADFASLGLE